MGVAPDFSAVFSSDESMEVLGKVNSKKLLATKKKLQAISR
jgi:hypothetical protein